ncbi:50S ribosomal protein L23 [bacterium]|nr:50S ribosomal protein L23 [bacterium]
MNVLTLKPVVTEKSVHAASAQVYTFEVPTDANKIEIRRALKEHFKVDAIAIRTVVSKGKVKRFKGVTGRRTDSKKAFVTLKKGQKIAIFEAEPEEKEAKKPAKKATVKTEKETK